MKSLVVFVFCATLAAGLASLPSSAVAQQKAPLAQDAVRAALALYARLAARQAGRLRPPPDTPGSRPRRHLRTPISKLG